MIIELKTTSLKEIIQICKNNHFDLSKVKIVNEIWTDFSKNEDYVKTFIKYNKK
jgi:hypothetical protein